MTTLAIARTGFTITAFKDIAPDPAAQWLVDGILPAIGLTIVFGESGTGKTFLVTDLELAIARGAPWADRKVIQGRVIHVVAEGAEGFRRRVAAYRECNRLPLDLPFTMIAGTPDLIANSGPLVAAIEEVAGEGGPPVRLITIDTFARSLGGADENSAADVGKAVLSCDHLIARFGCSVALIHHAGKDVSKGARGSSALRAAADCEILVEGQSDPRTVTVSKSRDGEAGQTMQFRLERVEFDVEGVPYCSCVVKLSSGWSAGAVKNTPRRKLSDRQRLALDVLTDLVIDGKFVPADWLMPTQLRAVEADQWKAALFSRGILDEEAPNPRADFKRVKESLLARKLIAERDGRIWIAQ